MSQNSEKISPTPGPPEGGASSACTGQLQARRGLRARARGQGRRPLPRGQKPGHPDRLQRHAGAPGPASCQGGTQARLGEETGPAGKRKKAAPSPPSRQNKTPGNKRNGESRGLVPTQPSKAEQPLWGAEGSPALGAGEARAGQEVGGGGSPKPRAAIRPQLRARWERDRRRVPAQPLTPGLPQSAGGAESLRPRLPRTPSPPRAERPPREVQELRRGQDWGRRSRASSPPRAFRFTASGEAPAAHAKGCGRPPHAACPAARPCPTDGSR
ncbi:uncharacterized protein [Dasypus novemcinctus]|uniref:uncharacterized protein n=1 Tax=Dasypus novemcinctus TaxID=9361 RepID=UPI0039C8D2B2